MPILFPSSTLILIVHFQIYKPVLHSGVRKIKWNKTFLRSTQSPFTSNHDVLKWRNAKLPTHGKHLAHLLNTTKMVGKWLTLKGQHSPLPSFHGCVPNRSDENKPDGKLGIFPRISKQVIKSRLWHLSSWIQSSQRRGTSGPGINYLLEWSLRRHVCPAPARAGCLQDRIWCAPWAVTSPFPSALPPTLLHTWLFPVRQPALVRSSHRPGLGKPESRFWLCPCPAWPIDPQQAIGLSVRPYRHLQNGDSNGPVILLLSYLRPGELFPETLTEPSHLLSSSIVSLY